VREVRARCGGDAGARGGRGARVPARELTGKGVALLNGPEDRAWGMRTANFQDPDGYVWEIATELPRQPA
jgi:catechol 2,3-dioxygenase-like lactoylglutathione lyase family enzyme